VEKITFIGMRIFYIRWWTYIRLWTFRFLTVVGIKLM